MTPTYVYAAYVERVVDGDTLDVAVDLGFRIQQRMRLRLLGIDAPEMKTEAGKAARQFVADLLDRHGLDVTLATTKPDKYGRTLARVALADGTDLADHLLRAGLARPYDGGAR